MAIFFGGNIRASTAAFRSGDYPDLTFHAVYLEERKDRTAANTPDAGGY